MVDPRVEHARSHFGSRFNVNGVPFADFHDVTDSIEKWEDWCHAWSQRGEIHEALGREALAKKHYLSASENLNQAAACYHFAKYLFVQDLEQMRAAHLRAVECYNLALPHFEYPGKRVEIPYEGKHLVGTLRMPPNVKRPPLIIMCNGLDSSKEELDSFQLTFVKRGMAALAVDGPGQGEGEYDFAIRADYEAVVGPIIDWAIANTDIDADKIGLWGLSLGGYYAPRAAAFEKRIKACVALGGPYDWGGVWDKLPPLTQDAFRVRSKSKDNAEAKRKAAELSLAGVAEKIECPMFVVSSGLDKLYPPSEAERLAREAIGKVELLVVPDGNHVAHNRAYCYRPQTADWLAEQLNRA